MFFIRHKYCLSALLAILLSNASFGQYTNTAKDSGGTTNRLMYYHSCAAAKPSRPYTKLSYTRPNNQLMSWANYPSTAEGVMRRFDQNGRDNDVKSMIAKDIIKSLFSKKKKVAVIPKY